MAWVRGRIAGSRWPVSWRALTAVIPDLGAMLAGRAEYQALREALFAVCDAEKAPLHLCGLSLGGVLALDYAAYRPERIASLVLIGTPCAMPKRLLKIQDLLFALMPRKLFTGLGMTKRQVRGLAASMAEVDIPALLPRVRCRTLVLCGEKDRANRKAAGSCKRAYQTLRCKPSTGRGMKQTARRRKRYRRRWQHFMAQNKIKEPRKKDGIPSFFLQGALAILW